MNSAALETACARFKLAPPIDLGDMAAIKAHLKTVFPTVLVEVMPHAVGLLVTLHPANTAAVVAQYVMKTI